MDIIQAIILGIVQGATEFLPVSSSGHLVLTPWWLGWPVPPDLVFSVAAHLGTLCAVLLYFRDDWKRIMRGGVQLLRTRSRQDPDGRLFALLVIGSVPIGVFGTLFARQVEAAFQQPVEAAALLLVTALMLIFSERKTATAQKRRTADQMTWQDALFVGLAQMLAIFPGVSRSGSTIAAGLYRGINRTDAARFSFLLGAPAILGAGLLAGLEMFRYGNVASQLPLLLAGFAGAAAIGYLSIAFLLTHLRQHRLYVFAVYCTVASLLSLLAAWLGR